MYCCQCWSASQRTCRRTDFKVWEGKLPIQYPNGFVCVKMCVVWLLINQKFTIFLCWSRVVITCNNRWRSCRAFCINLFWLLAALSKHCQPKRRLVLTAASRSPNVSCPVLNLLNFSTFDRIYNNLNDNLLGRIVKIGPKLS